jgi:hypothetical protein
MLFDMDTGKRLSALPQKSPWYGTYLRARKAIPDVLTWLEDAIADYVNARPR